MKNWYLYILTIILISSCSKPFIISDAKSTHKFYKMFGEDNSRNFYVNNFIKDSLKFLWNSSAYGSFSNTSFTAFDKYLFVADLGGTITSFNIEDGKNTGEYKNKGEIYQTPIINIFKLAYVVNQLNETYSNFIIYDFKFGKQLFSKKLPGKITNELIFIDNFYFVISNEGILFKLNLQAEIVFEKDLRVKVNSKPAAYGENIFIASSNGNLFSISAETGKINFKEKISEGFSSGISIDNQNVFIGDNVGKLYSINILNGKVNWEFNTNSKIIATPSIDKQNIYIGNLKGELFAIDKHNGKLIWNVDTKGLINTTALVLDNAIVQPNLKNRVDIFNKSNGQLIQQLNFEHRCKSTPLYYDNKIFFGTERGEIYCYAL